MSQQFTADQIRRHNARVAAEAIRAAEKRNTGILLPPGACQLCGNIGSHDKRCRIGAHIKKSEAHDNPTRPEIPNAEQRKRAKKLGGCDARETPSSGCPNVRFTLRRVRLLDVDSKFHSCKDLIDALTHCGAIPGDKEGQITLEVQQERVSKYDLEETIIEIETP